MDSYFQDKELHGYITKSQLHRANHDIIDKQFNHNTLNMKLMLVKNSFDLGRIEVWKPYDWPDPRKYPL